MVCSHILFFLARECHFGSQKAYSEITDYFFTLTGCPTCLSDPGCACSNCDTSGILKALLDQAKFQSLSSNNVTWPQHPLCANNVIQSLLCYQSSSLPAEGKLASALPILFQLCSITNGLSAGGECESNQCHDCPATAPCNQSEGADSSSRYFISLYIISSVFLWQFATEIDATTLFQGDSSQSTKTKFTTNEKKKYMALQTFESSAPDTLSLLSIGEAM